MESYIPDNVVHKHSRSVLMSACSGKDPGLSLGGGGGGGGAPKVMWAHAYASWAKSAKSLRRPGSRVLALDALSCYLSLIFKHYDTKHDKKTKTIQIWRGGGGGVCCALTKSATVHKYSRSVLNVDMFKWCMRTKFRFHLQDKSLLTSRAQHSWIIRVIL